MVKKKKKKKKVIGIVVLIIAIIVGSITWKFFNPEAVRKRGVYREDARIEFTYYTAKQALHQAAVKVKNENGTTPDLIKTEEFNAFYEVVEQTIVDCGSLEEKYNVSVGIEVYDSELEELTRLKQGGDSPLYVITLLDFDFSDRVEESMKLLNDPFYPDFYNMTLLHITFH